MFEIVTSCDIDVPSQRVWQVLIDFDSYSRWNPFIVKASLQKDQDQISDNNLQNQTLLITTQVMGSKPKIFNPKIIVAIPNKKLSWVGKIGFEALLKAEHSFSLQDLDKNKTRLIHSEKFSGILSGIINQKQRDEIKECFEKMNIALAEKSYKE
jgi:hypothetical protein